jgi:O-antigen/teichoic acid export membrane protein
MVLGAGVAFVFVNNSFIYTLNAMGRQIDATRLAAMSLVLNIALNVVLIPQSSPVYGGYMGAAWATVLTEVGLFAGGWYLLRRHLFALPVLGSLRGVLPSGIVAGAAMYGIVLLLGAQLPAYLAAAVVGAVIYGVGLKVSGAFTPEELELAREAVRALARR